MCINQPTDGFLRATRCRFLLAATFPHHVWSLDCFTVCFTATSLHWLVPIPNIITYKGNLGFYSSWMQLFLKLTVRKEAHPGLKCCQIPGKVPESEANFSIVVEVFDYNITKSTMVPGDIVPDAYAAGTGVRQQTSASKPVKFLPFNIWNPSSVPTLFPHLQRRRKSGESAWTEFSSHHFKGNSTNQSGQFFSDLSQSLLK